MVTGGGVVFEEGSSSGAVTPLGATGSGQDETDTDKTNNGSGEEGDTDGTSSDNQEGDVDDTGVIFVPENEDEEEGDGTLSLLGGGEISILAAGDITTTITSGSGAFRTYTDQANKANTPIGTLAVGLRINMTNNNLAGGTIKIPLNYSFADAVLNQANIDNEYAFEYGTDGNNGTSGDSSAPDFFSYSGISNEADIVTNVDDSNPDYLILELAENKASGSYDITLNFTFTSAYDGKIPHEAVLWTIAPETYLAGDKVHTTTPATVVADAPTEVTHDRLEMFYPTDGNYSSGVATWRIRHEVKGYYQNYFDPTYANYFYLDVPNGSTLNTYTLNYFNGTPTASPDHADYTRYYRYVTDINGPGNTNENYNYWWYSDNPFNSFQQTDGGVTPDPSLVDGEAFSFYFGSNIKRTNGAVVKTGGFLDYEKKDIEDWAISTSSYHNTSSAQYSIVVNEPGNYQEARYDVRAAAVGTYGRDNTLNNMGKSDITDLSMTLYQASSGSAKLNFHYFQVYAIKQQGTTDPTNYYKVIFEIEGGTPRIVETTPQRGAHWIDLSALGLVDGEYINKATVVPMGSDGTRDQEGVLCPSNGFGILYRAAAWDKDTWPDGTTIPELTKVPMEYTISYYDAIEGTDKTVGGADTAFSHYYTSSAYTDAQVYLSSSEATGALPGQTITYHIQARNYDAYSAGSWVEPYIAVRVPSCMSYAGPTTITLTDLASSQTYDVSVSQIRSNANYNYYAFQVEDGYAAPMGGNTSVFNIPAQFKVAEGTPEGSSAYTINAFVSSKDHSKFRKIRETNGIGGSSAAYFGLGGDNDYWASMGASYHDQLVVGSATNAAGSSLVKGDSTGGEWVESELVAATKNSDVYTQLVIENTGNTTMESVKLYNILPFNGDGRGDDGGSTGSISFSGVENVSGATVYYWIGAGAPPAYAANLDIQGMNPAANSTNWSTTYSASAKAIYIDFGNTTLAGAQTLTGDLKFHVPDADDQVAVNQFMFSGMVGSTAQNYTSSMVTFSTEIITLDYFGNKPTTATALDQVEGVPSGEIRAIGVDTDPFDIPTAKPTLANHTFVEWNTQANGSGQSYDPGDSIAMGSSAATHMLYAIWTLNSADISYTNNDDGTAGSATAFDAAPLTSYVYTDLPYTLPTPKARANMEFVGWTGTGITGDPVMTHTVAAGTTGNLAFVANWKSVKAYEVNHWLVASNGTITKHSSQNPEPTGLVGDTKTATSISIPGYTYNASFDDGENATLASGTIPATGKLVLNLYYDVHTYAVSYSYSTSAPSAAVDPSTLGQASVDYGSEVNVAATPATGASVGGYTFSGWTTSDATVDSGKFSMPDSAVAFTGSWTANTNTAYQVKHHKLGTDGNITSTETEPKTGTTGTTATATSKTYAGYTYQADYSGTAGTENASGTITGDGLLVLNLYYTVNTNNVSYSYTTSAPSGAVDPVTLGATGVAYGSEVNVASTPATGASVGGYTFSGWTTSDATVDSGKFDMPDSAVAFTGYWTANGDTAYTVKHHKVDADGAIVSTETEPKTGTTGANGTASAKSYVGYTYKAGYTGTAGTENASGAITGDGLLVLNLYYPINKHDVSYSYSNTAPASALDPDTLEQTDVPYNTEVSVAATPAKDAFVEGYTFSGWETVDATVDSGKFDMPDDDVAFTGSWESVEYDITYEDLYGAFNTNQTTYKTGDADIVLADPGERAGYTFAGWALKVADGQIDPTNLSADKNGLKGATIKQGSYGDMVATAQWTAKTVTVSYVTDGDAFTTTTGKSASYDGTVAMPSATPTKTGFIFSGWKQADKGIDWSFGTSGTKVTTANGVVGADTNAPTLTLTAQWDPVYYNLRFDLNGGGSDVPKAQSLKYGDLAEPVADPSRGSHTFQGWNTAADGSGSGWNFASTKMPANHVTLYAQWQYSGGGGGTDPETPPPVRPPVITPVTPEDPDPPAPGGGGGTAPTVTPQDPAPVREPGTETEITPDTEPALSGFQIGEDGIPRSGPTGEVWALLNFILMVIGGVFAVGLLIRKLVKNRRREEDGELAFAGADGGSYTEAGDDDEQKRPRPMWTVISIILGFVGVIVFLLTEDMSNMMVWLDGWTLVMAVIFAAEFIAFRLSFKKDKDAKEDKI